MAMTVTCNTYSPASRSSYSPQPVLQKSEMLRQRLGDAMAAMQQALTLPWLFQSPDSSCWTHAHPVRPTQPMQRPHDYGLSVRPGGGRSHLQPDTRDYQGYSQGSVLPPLDEKERSLETYPFSLNPITLGYFSVSSVTAQLTQLSHVEQGSWLLQMSPKWTPSQSVHSIGNVAW